MNHPARLLKIFKFLATVIVSSFYTFFDIMTHSEIFKMRAVIYIFT